jgi:hypothetical protein
LNTYSEIFLHNVKPQPPRLDDGFPKFCAVGDGVILQIFPQQEQKIPEFGAIDNTD